MLTKARSVFPSKQMGGDHLDNPMANYFLAAKNTMAATINKVHVLLTRVNYVINLCIMYSKLNVN